MNKKELVLLKDFIRQNGINEIDLKMVSPHIEITAIDQDDSNTIIKGIVFNDPFMMNIENLNKSQTPIFEIYFQEEKVTYKITYRITRVKERVFLRQQRMKANREMLLADDVKATEEPEIEFELKGTLKTRIKNTHTEDELDLLYKEIMSENKKKYVAPKGKLSDKKYVAPHARNNFDVKISNLVEDVTETEIRDAFKQYVYVRRIHIIRSRNEHPGYAYISLTCQEDKDKVVDVLSKRLIRIGNMIVD